MIRSVGGMCPNWNENIFVQRKKKTVLLWLFECKFKLMNACWGWWGRVTKVVSMHVMCACYSLLLGTAKGKPWIHLPSPSTPTLGSNLKFFSPKREAFNLTRIHGHTKGRWRSKWSVSGFTPMMVWSWLVQAVDRLFVVFLNRIIHIKLNPSLWSNKK
jgi:hypothetical protein